MAKDGLDLPAKSQQQLPKVDQLGSATLKIRSALNFAPICTQISDI